MGLVLEQIETEGLAQLSYLVGDDSSGEAAVIDPRRDVDVYLERARAPGLRLLHAVETHIHADFVSGSRELQARTGARIHGGRSDGYRFDLEPLSDLQVGDLRLQALHTPGHTPEHVSVLLVDPGQGEEPCAIFTGDTLFNRDVGRPDLAGDDAEGPARDLYRSLFRKLVPLGDRMEVYPGHGAGSGCGKSIGDHLRTTIGNERLYSDALKERSEDEFVHWLLEGLPEPPRHYRRLKEVNARGPSVRGGCVPVLPPLPPGEVRERQGKGALVLDARSMLAFVARGVGVGTRPGGEEPVRAPPGGGAGRVRPGPTRRHVLRHRIPGHRRGQRPEAARLPPRRERARFLDGLAGRRAGGREAGQTSRRRRPSPGPRGIGGG